jgi:AraC-like DNA-binding protein
MLIIVAMGAEGDIAGMILNLSRTNRHRSSAHATFGDVVYSPGGTCGPRVQQDYQLVIIYAGDVTIRIDESDLYVPAQHTVLLLPQRREHFRFSPTRATHHAWCAITPGAVPVELRRTLQRHARCMPLTTRVHHLIEIGLSVPSAGLAAADALLDSIALSALHACVFESAAALIGDDMPHVLIVAQQYMETHLAESISVPQIAGSAHVTPQHLTRLFRRHVGTTPMRYLWQLRTRRGVELLHRTGLSITAIAERVGFSSPYHFSRLVRQHYAHSPRDLRRRVWLSGAGDPALDQRGDSVDR